MNRRLATSLAALALIAAAPAACGSSSTSDGTTVGGDGGATTPPTSPTGTTTPPAGADGGDAAATNDAASGNAIKTVFVIMMENHSWSTIKGNANAPYINGTLLTQGAHAEAYSTPAGNHPSEPNYLWLEAGDNLGIKNDNEPSSNHQSTKDHLSAQLEAAGISWKAYVENIDGASCPLTSAGYYGTKHTPQLFFDDMTDANSATSAHCIAHVRPYTELAGDLTGDKVARYNFITPNLCDDMHGVAFDAMCNSVGQGPKMISNGDTWLAAEVPKILASAAYKDNGVLFVLWDEGDESGFGSASDGPIPFFALSPLAKKGFSTSTVFTHSSLLRTVERIFGVPYLRGAMTATDLSEMFTTFP